MNEPAATLYRYYQTRGSEFCTNLTAIERNTGLDWDAIEYGTLDLERQKLIRVDRGARNQHVGYYHFRITMMEKAA